MFVGWLIVLAILEIGNAASLHLVFARGADFGYGIVPLFNFDRESNFPTLFNGGLLAFGSLVAFSIHAWMRSHGTDDMTRRAWFGIGAVLAFLAIDELCLVHEALDWFLMARLGTTGAIAWPWVIPYAVIAIGVGVFFLRFFLSLERRYRWTFAAAALLYVGAAIGFEMLEAIQVERHGVDSLGYGLLYTVEETLEMLAVMIANHGLMLYAIRECKGIDLRVRFAATR